MPTKIYNKPTLKTKRQSLRQNQTPFEAKLWYHLKGGQLKNRKFRRQYSIGPYIADFFCIKEKLAIEIDGDSHFVNPEAIKRDFIRTKFFNSLGIRVMRFLNNEVAENIEGVLEEIVRGFGR